MTLSSIEIHKLGSAFAHNTLEYQLTKKLSESLSSAAGLAIPETPEELYQAVIDITGLSIPNIKVCPGHCSPFDAFVDAYYAKHPISVWLASRGFGGKSIMLAQLSMVEAVTLGAAVNLLGGSGEQAKRVHGYMRGEDTNIPHTFWGNPGAPDHLLLTEPTSNRTRLTNFGRIQVLMASQTSVRGPHPQRLRLDEVDEMSIEIFDAAMGQTMEARGIREQTVASSTWQNPDGTMTEILRRASDNGWPVYQWCYKETMQGWLSPAQVERKRETISESMWTVEYDLQEPRGEMFAIDPTKVDNMFKHELGEYEGIPGEAIVVEPYDAGTPELDTEHPHYVQPGSYVTAADWAKKTDRTVITTIRIDCTPARIVAFQQMGRLPWPDMIAAFDKQANDYPGEAVHDATGLGDVVDDLITVDAYPIYMVGRHRQDIFSNYIKAIENAEIISPFIRYLYGEHRYCKRDDLYKAGGHPPDSFVSCALAWTISGGGWSRGMG